METETIEQPSVGKRSKNYLLLIPGLAWVGLFLFVPIIFLLVMSFYTAIGGGGVGGHIGYIPILTLANYIYIFSTPAYLEVMRGTIQLCLTQTFLCFIVGYPAAYALALSIKSTRYKTVLFLLMLIPFWIDWTIRTIAWYPILGVKGFLNYLLVSSGIVSEPVEAFLFSTTSLQMVWTQAYTLFMIAPIYLTLIRLDPILLQAAQSLGANRLKTFYHIVFKMSLPGVVIGCVFVFVMSLADYATPRLIGGGIATLGKVTWDLQSQLFWPYASALALVILALSFAIVWLMLRVVDVKSILGV